MDSNWISPFWQAFSMPTHSRVCGMRVPPLSVWHVFALEQIGNTYLCGGLLEAGDAAQILLVASRNRRQFLRMFASQKRTARAVARIRRRILRTAWRRGTEAVAQCRAYAEQSMRVPGRWVKDGAKPCAVPHTLHVLSAAVQFGIPIDRAWDMPYAQARCLFDALAEAKGDESIQTAAAQQMDEAMAAENEQGAANG
jgi:hypothetical protein